MVQVNHTVLTIRTDRRVGLEAPRPENDLEVLRQTVIAMFPTEEPPDAARVVQTAIVVSPPETGET
jgi:hypothetical protein